MEEGIKMETRKKISKKVAERYKKASKKEKGKILDEFVKLLGYNRSYASYLLSNIGKKVVVYRNRERVVFIGEGGKIKGRGRKKIYGEREREALVKNFVSGSPPFYILN